jgi:hypothetical protein
MFVIGVVAATLAITCFAASQGPSVCELDGPTPILNISNTEINFSIDKTNVSEFRVDINNWGII